MPQIVTPYHFQNQTLARHLTNYGTQSDVLRHIHCLIYATNQFLILEFSNIETYLFLYYQSFAFFLRSLAWGLAWRLHPFGARVADSPAGCGGVTKALVVMSVLAISLELIPLCAVIASNMSITEHLGGLTWRYY